MKKQVGMSLCTTQFGWGEVIGNGGGRGFAGLG